MAEAWIPMRTNLPFDPKVIHIGELLFADREFREAFFPHLPPDYASDVSATCPNCCATGCATCCATVRTGASQRCACVALALRGLLGIWGLVNERGRSEGADVILESASLKTIDDTSQVPGMGRALLVTKWISISERDGVRCVVFRNFSRLNTITRERSGESSTPAERMRRLRARRKAVSEATEKPGLCHEGTATGEGVSDVARCATIAQHVAHTEQDRTGQNKEVTHAPSQENKAGLEVFENQCAQKESREISPIESARSESQKLSEVGDSAEDARESAREARTERAVERMLAQVVVPKSIVDSPELRQSLGQWARYFRNREGRIWSAIDAQGFLATAAMKNWDAATVQKSISFSIAKSAKSWLNPANDFNEPQDQAKPKKWGQMLGTSAEELVRRSRSPVGAT